LTSPLADLQPRGEPREPPTRDQTPRRPGRRLAGLFVLLALGTLGCPGRSTPEAACEQLFHAIAEGDASAVFDGLLQTTQWSFYTVVKNHRQMRELILASYPAEQQPAALARLYGADADNGRELFMRLYPQRYEKSFTERLGSGPLRVDKPAGGEGGAAGAPVRCQLQQGQPFTMQRAASGRWGLGELDREWDEAQLRTFHDLATVQKNAELYRKVRPAQPRDKQP
jgi:hypothetical protein